MSIEKSTFTPERNRKNRNETKTKLARNAFILTSLFVVGTALYVGANKLVDYITGGGDGSDKKIENVAGSYLDKDINSITIDSDSRLREDPLVNNQYDAPNIVDSIDKKITINTEEGALVKEDYANGEFYGIPVEKIKEQIPDYDEKGGKDGVVWVNEATGDVDRSAESN